MNEEELHNYCAGCKTQIPLLYSYCPHCWGKKKQDNGSSIENTLFYTSLNAAAVILSKERDS